MKALGGHVFRADDVEKAISDFAHSTDPFDVWLKVQDSVVQL
jgi:hypothetical protein